MIKKVVWLTFIVVACAALLVSCGQSPPTTKNTPTQPPTVPATVPTTSAATTPAVEKPKYGGTLSVATGMTITTWDPTRVISGEVPGLYLNKLWEGDWSKGPAGGYGTGETDWGFGNNDLFSLKFGVIVKSWEWSVDSDGKGATIIYQIRPGVHWALDRNNAASRLVNGRAVTADDVVFSLQRATTWSLGFVFSSNPELRNVPITKTGPMEVTIKVPISGLYTGIIRFGGGIHLVPPEVVKAYGDMSDWKNQVGTGAFIVTDFVTDSMCTAIRNPNFWMTNPVGPGKGDQLPYIDKVKVMVVPDVSTRYAALRTGKVDRIVPIPYDDANELRKSAIGIKEIKSTHWQGRGSPYFMRTDKPPFDNVKVRRAMNMAVDRQSILNSQFGGQGQIFPFPFAYVPEYDPLYLKPTDPDYPEILREIYTYNPEKARQLLKEAGYPNGFRTEMLVNSASVAEIDMATIFKEMWAKIGVVVDLLPREPGVKANMSLNWTHPPMIPDTTGPVAVFVVGNSFAGIRFNLSIVKDPVIDKFLADCREAAATDLTKAMKVYREMTKYALEQAFHVPDVQGPQSLMYWPWLKNYSGEICVGYDNMNVSRYIWIDQDLKRKMGY